MKTNIATTKDQSQRLLRCGVSADTADMTWGERDLMTMPYTEAQRYNKENYGGGMDYAPAWSLSALISLLPKEIHSGNYILEMLADNAGWEVCYRFDKNNIISVADKEELVDALYDAVVWCIDNNHVKLD